MRRRDFISFFGIAAVAQSVAAYAQPSDKLPVIGFLGSSSLSTTSKFVAAFVDRLHDHGWSEGRNVFIEYRWAEGSNERTAEIATEFARLKVAVIVTHSNAAAAIAKKATSIIPIVFAVAGDPLGTGLVASLARPGGNITGLSLQATDTAAKRFELLREVIPGFHRLAVMANVTSPVSVLEMKEVQTAARTGGLEVVSLEIRQAADIVPAFATLKGRADALYLVGDPLIVAKRVAISTLAVGAGLNDACSTKIKPHKLKPDELDRL